MQESLFLSTGGNWNDIPDRISFNPPGANVIRFGACFSVSESESVAMWMLHGGLHKEGVMADFSRNQINSCLNTEYVALGVWKGREFSPIMVLDKNMYTI